MSNNPFGFHNSSWMPPVNHNNPEEKKKEKDQQTQAINGAATTAQLAPNQANHSNGTATVFGFGGQQSQSTASHPFKANNAGLFSSSTTSAPAAPVSFGTATAATATNPSTTTSSSSTSGQSWGTPTHGSSSSSAAGWGAKPTTTSTSSSTATSNSTGNTGPSFGVPQPSSFGVQQSSSSQATTAAAKPAETHFGFGTTTASAGMFGSPVKSSSAASTAAPAGGFGLTGLTASPAKPAITGTGGTNFASPSKPPTISHNPERAPFSFAASSTSTASPSKPAPTHGTTTTSSNATATHGLPRKSSLEKQQQQPAATTTTPRKSSLETPRKSSIETEKVLATPQSMARPTNTNPTTSAQTVVTPVRNDDSFVKAKESAAILSASLTQQTTALPSKLKQENVAVNSPVSKKYRSESIDDSWVKIDKEEIEGKKKSEPAKDLKDKEPKEKKSAVAMPKKAKVEKPKAPVTSGTRRTSGRARQAPKEDLILATVTAATKSSAATSSVKGVEIPTGTGQKLGDIPHVSAQLNKLKAADKTILLAHRLIFGRPGEANKRKADLRQFNGLPSSTDQAALDKKLASQTLPSLRALLVLFNLERSGEKQVVVERLRAFLLNPKDLGKSKPAPVAKKGKVVAKGKQSKKTKTTATVKTAAKKGKVAKVKSTKLSADVVESEDDFAEEIASLKADTMVTDNQ